MKDSPETPEERLAELLKKVTIVSDEEAEKVDYVVCMPADAPEYFKDNLRGHCSVCNREIVFRPYVPKTPPKVCIHCINLLQQAEMIQ